MVYYVSPRARARTRVLFDLSEETKDEYNSTSTDVLRDRQTGKLCNESFAMALAYNITYIERSARVLFGATCVILDVLLFLLQVQPTKGSLKLAPSVRSFYCADTEKRTMHRYFCNNAFT